MLKETDLSISEVAFRSGYQSLPSFTRRFGKQFGITPAAFRGKKGRAKLTDTPFLLH